ncbi:Major facilitator superfamily transporter protein [Rutstroemia sp. NJR-2017a BVV2]|nr:Major facilitator superfamily transporter protein [Rutstroemia sp. NJR-2017a BVV2]
MAGCIFDIMTFAWTPPACLDTEIHDDVTSELSELAPTRGAGTWPWWRWSNRTEPLEQSAEVLGQFDDIWTDTYYHRAHCLYLQRIMHRASMRVKDGEKDVYVYFRAYDYGHVIHCNKLLNELDVPLTERPATVSRVIGHCVKMS